GLREPGRARRRAGTKGALEGPRRCGVPRGVRFSPLDRAGPELGPQRFSRVQLGYGFAPSTEPPEPPPAITCASSYTAKLTSPSGACARAGARPSGVRGRSAPDGRRRLRAV